MNLLNNFWIKILILVYLIFNYIMIPKTKHFGIHEFHSKDGERVPNKYYPNVKKMMNALEVIRAEIGHFPIYINSGFRSKKHNANVGGVVNSQHLKAKAVDIRTLEFSPKELAVIILNLMRQGKIPKGHIIEYPNFVHYDIRGIEKFYAA